MARGQNTARERGRSPCRQATASRSDNGKGQNHRGGEGGRERQVPLGTPGSAGVQREVTPGRSPGEVARGWLHDLGPRCLGRDQPPARRPRCRHPPRDGHTKQPMPRGRVARAGREDTAGGKMSPAGTGSIGWAGATAAGHLCCRGAGVRCSSQGQLQILLSQGGQQTVGPKTPWT